MLSVRGRSALFVQIVVAGLVVSGLLVSLAGCAPSTVASSTPMRSTQFWGIIDAARGTSDPTAASASPSALKKQLESLSDSKVEAFAIRYNMIMVRLNQWAVWDAGYAAAQGMGDDGFDYFRAWLIGKGRTVVQQAESDPDELVKYLTAIDASKDDFDNELLDYVADDVLVKRLGQSADDAFDAKLPATVDDDPVGKETDENTIDARYPLLAAWAKIHDH